MAVHTALCRYRMSLPPHAVVEPISKYVASLDVASDESHTSASSVTACIRTIVNEFIAAICCDATSQRFPVHPYTKHAIWRYFAAAAGHSTNELCKLIDTHEQQLARLENMDGTCFYRTLTIFDDGNEYTVPCRTLVKAIGSIGHSIWPAAFVLNQFLLSNKAMLKGKCVLELGAGTCVSSIVSHRCEPAIVVATDYDPDVIDDGKHNFENCWKDLCPCGAPVHCKCMWRVCSLDWNDKRAIDDVAPDVVMAADCAYAPEDLDAFASTVRNCLLPKRADSVAILVQTERNPNTFVQYVMALREAGLVLSAVDMDCLSSDYAGLIDDTVHIHIGRLHLSL